MLTFIFLDFLLGKPTSAVGACNGIVVGLVAITPACGYVTVGSALVIGIIAGGICYAAGILMKQRTSVDDSLDVFAVHGLGGTVGFLCTAIFSSLDVNPAGANGLIYGQGITLAKHIAIVLCIAPCIFISTYCIFAVVDFIVPLRVTEEEEAVGLDKSMHSEEYGHVPIWKPSGSSDGEGNAGFVGLDSLSAAHDGKMPVINRPTPRNRDEKPEKNSEADMDGSRHSTGSIVIIADFK